MKSMWKFVSSSYKQTAQRTATMNNKHNYKVGSKQFKGLLFWSTPFGSCILWGVSTDTSVSIETSTDISIDVSTDVSVEAPQKIHDPSFLRLSKVKTMIRWEAFKCMRHVKL